MNPIRHAAGLEILRRRGRRVHGRWRAVARGREGFVDRNGDGGQLRRGHAREVEQVKGGVDEGDVEVWGERVSGLRGQWEGGREVPMPICLALASAASAASLAASRLRVGSGRVAMMGVEGQDWRGRSLALLYLWN